jgi:hypothetical protein
MKASALRAVLRQADRELDSQVELEWTLTVEEVLDFASGVMYLLAEEVDDEDIRRILESTSESLAAMADALR